MKKSVPALVLASSSPRRQELLRKVGLKFKVASPEADESVRHGESGKALVQRLAHAKAMAAALKLSARRRPLVILAADTTVVAPSGAVLNKPRSTAEARAMLRALSGKTHQVHTAYALFAPGTKPKTKMHVRVVTSQVRIKKLSPAVIAAYVQTGEPMDKAGAYAAQGIGMAFIAAIRGSYTNVVGLPMAEVLDDLEREFGISPWKR